MHYETLLINKLLIELFYFDYFFFSYLENLKSYIEYLAVSSILSFTMFTKRFIKKICFIYIYIYIYIKLSYLELEFFIYTDIFSKNDF